MSKRQPVVFTEAEAAKKDCIAGGKCTGNNCMGWRWAIGKHTNEFNKRVIEEAKTAGHNDWGKAHQKLLKENVQDTLEYTEGYCGAAGEPNASPRL